MYYPLYVSNKWVEPLDKYLNDATLTDPAWFTLRRHHQGLARRRFGRRQALRHPLRRRGHGAGLPQGPLRREGPEAGRDLRAAAGQRQGADRPGRAHLRPGDPRLCRRRPEHVRLPVDLPRLRRQLDARRQGRRQFARGRQGARVVRRRADEVRAAGSAQLELAGHRRRVLAGHGRHLPRRAFVGGGDHQPREVEGGRQDRLRALAQGPVGQARHLDLELGLPGQCGA